MLLHVGKPIESVHMYICVLCVHARLLTHTCESISTVAFITGTGEATRGVGTECISVTVISISGTLIKICKGKIQLSQSCRARSLYTYLHR